MKRLVQRLVFFVVFVSILSVNHAFAAKDVLIANFEGNDYGNWKVQGQAFGSRPAKGTLDGQMKVSRFKGKGLVNSYYNGDKSVGMLTSPRFEIQRKYINFLIGGGKYPAKTCINLLVDGIVVRSSTGPNDINGRSEALDWAYWDVGQFKGKQAVIQIVDQQKGSWGHINIDHIIQSDKPKQSDRHQTIRQMTFNKRYLNMPVKNGGTKRILSVIIDGKKVREFVIELADDHRPDYWVWLDIDEFRDKKATLQIDSLPTNPKALAAIYQDDKVKEADAIYKERNRQQFHLSSKRGWNNDVNGMVYYKGEYHLFWQHNPFGWKWDNMTWGHAVSPDCVHWTEIGDAIHPDEMGTIFSGSAVVDHNNCAGFQTGDEKVIVCFYTSAGGTSALSRDQPFTQSIAYSNDRGRTWTKYKGNPVIGRLGSKLKIDSNRDPKVFWHEPTKRWIMALILDRLGAKPRWRRVAFYSSTDMKNWTKNSQVEGFWDCPEFFELPIDGDKSNTKWVHYGGRGDYSIGEFDGKTYKAETKDIINISKGNCFYGAQTFNNIPKSDGRRIQMAWGRIATPGMPFNQCVLFPVCLTLRTTEDGVRMFAEPIAEIKNIHGKKHTWKNEIVRSDQNLLSDISGELFHIRGTFQINSTDKFSFNIRGTEVLYDAEQNRISCKDKSAKLKPQNGKIVLEMLVDRNSIEIFANNGRVYMPMGGILPKNNKTLKLLAKTAEVKIEQLDIYELKSVWK